MSAQFRTMLTSPAIAAVAGFIEACNALTARRGIDKVVSVCHQSFPFPLPPGHSMVVTLQVVDKVAELVPVHVTVTWNEKSRCWCPAAIVSPLLSAVFAPFPQGLSEGRIVETWF